MIIDLSALADPATSGLTVGFLVFLRVGAATFMLPAFGEMVIPVRVRLMIALALTVVIYPVVEAGLFRELNAGQSVLILGAVELLAGLLLGLSLRLLVWSLHVASMIAAQATSLSQLLGGASVDPQPALGMILLWGALALAATLGLHVRYAALFVLSYDIIQPGQWLGGGEILQWLVPALSRTFEFAFLAAMPFVAASLIYNLTLGVINKAMPQLMVAFVGAPAITFGALVLLTLSAPLILSVWLEMFSAVLNDPLGPR